eukprot:TRINITY_DN10383_c0_g1_i1.p1 TRINITY_DN10383_c0_g1~~TRINITY_DN10383_c0_g1_i1.p1  ORF type:complete len:360 (+),score=76.78 TRINITY_DN10383_c0_g1_i1:363-1442(+)
MVPEPDTPAYYGDVILVSTEDQNRVAKCLKNFDFSDDLFDAIFTGLETALTPVFESYLQTDYHSTPRKPQEVPAMNSEIELSRAEETEASEATPREAEKEKEKGGEREKEKGKRSKGSKVKKSTSSPRMSSVARSSSKTKPKTSSPPPIRKLVVSEDSDLAHLGHNDEYFGGFCDFLITNELQEIANHYRSLIRYREKLSSDMRAGAALQILSDLPYFVSSGDYSSDLVTFEAEAIKKVRLCARDFQFDELIFRELEDVLSLVLEPLWTTFKITHRAPAAVFKTKSTRKIPKSPDSELKRTGSMFKHMGRRKSKKNKSPALVRKANTTPDSFSSFNEFDEMDDLPMFAGSISPFPRPKD